MLTEKNEKLKSHFCHTKGNRLKLNKTAKLNFCSTLRQIVKGFVRFTELYVSGRRKLQSEQRTNFIVCSNLIHTVARKLNLMKLTMLSSFVFNSIVLHLIREIPFPPLNTWWLQIEQNCAMNGKRLRCFKNTWFECVIKFQKRIFSLLF